MQRALVVIFVVLSLLAAPLDASATSQNDAGTGGDAGDTFADATLVEPRGHYEGRLDRGGGDVHDFYRFHLDEGSSVSVLVQPTEWNVDPVTLLDPNGLIVDIGTRTQGVGMSTSGVLTSEGIALRLAVHRATTSGEYRLHLRSEDQVLTSYTLCFLNCEEPRDAAIEFVFGGSLRHTNTQVLLVPPSHGDLGNPFGPTVVDYIDATLRGMRKWTEAMDAFAADHPEFAYLRDITVDIEIFDGATPVDPAGYDVIIGYVAAGPAFRGVASGGPGNIQPFLDELGLGDTVHFSGRVIALSLFGSSPRMGQVVYDFPEVNDLETVTMHEFGHTFGLGHTLTWHPTFGPDLMNSPATFVYGDGSPVGDGGERTDLDCISSLDLYGMSFLYRWIPDGEPQTSRGRVTLPADIPYSLYC